MMLLTIDVGNTNISLGLVQEEKVIASFRLTTKTPRTSDEYVMCMNAFFETSGNDKKDVEAVIVSSVVPKIMYSLNSAIYKYLGQEPLIVGPGIKTGIEIKTENPKEVGADRIVDCVAAYYTYHRSCIIVDFGTATTFDYISAEGVFANTVIMPGLQISAQALTANAAKLPEVEIRRPESILGKNTISGIQSGVVYGYIGACEYIIKTMKKELHDPDALVIATGGLGKVIASETEAINLYDPDIAYKGMSILYRKNRKK